MSYLDEAFKDLHELEDGVDLQDEQEVKDAIAFMNGDEDNLAQLELIVDADADSEEDIKDTYVGELLLYCPVCHTIHYEKEENIVFDEENDEIVNVGDACPHCKQENGYEIVGKVEEYDATEDEKEDEKEPTEDDDVPLELDDIEDFEDEETTKKVEESFKIRKRLKEHFEEDNLEELARFTGERLHTRERIRETKKDEPKKVEPKQSLKESKASKKALKESDEQIYIYQLPKDANVNYIRQNIGLTSANSIKLVGKVNRKGDQPGDILISGTKEDLAKFVDDYFDLQLLDDYLYEEDEFDTDLITPLKVKESKLVEKPVYGLEPRYDSRKSFYGKAQVDTGDKGDKNKLYSYDTLVAEIKGGKPVVYGTYSQTTLRHIKEWLKQLGFKAENSKQILADYGAKKESCKESGYLGNAKIIKSLDELPKVNDNYGGKNNYVISVNKTNSKNGYDIYTVKSQEKEARDNKLGDDVDVATYSFAIKKESCKEAKETKLSKEAQFLKGAYEDLKDNPTGTHYYDLGLDSGLHLVVGEYEDEICVKVAYNCDDLQCDYDYDWEMPLYKNGECAFVEDALDENTDWNKEAQYLVKEARAMDKEIASGELVCESCGKGKKRTKQKVKEGYYDYMDKDYAHILDSNVDVYDVNAYILKDSDNKFKAHYTDEYAIIVAPNGKGCVVDYEAVGQDFDSVESKIDFGAVENKDEERTDEKGNKYKTISIIATHRLTTTPKEIMENAPKKTMKYKDFFKKYKYNDRCASNFRELVSYLQSNGAFKGEKVTESKKRLNEGPGAGYSVKGKVTNVHNVEVVSDVESESEYYSNTLMATAECDIVDVSASSYDYGREIVNGSPIPAKLEIKLDYDKDEFNNGATQVVEALGDDFEFDATIGGGWVHSTFTGVIEGDYHDVENSPYSTDILNFTIKIENENVIKDIDKAVTGEDWIDNYDVIDTDNEIMDSFETEEEAIDYAKKNRGVAVEHRQYQYALLDDFESEDIIDEYSDGTVWEREYTKSYKYDDEPQEEALNTKKVPPVITDEQKACKDEECKKKELDESLIVTCDFDDYKPWSGAIENYEKIEEEGKLDDLENLLEECYPEGISMVEINDILWFDSDWVFEELGINENDDEDEEDFDESLFESLVDRYCQRVYDNVRDFKTISCSKKEKNFVVEGILHYTNGKKAKTTFTFKEAKAPNGKRKFVGLNETFSKDNKAFTLLVSTGDKKLLSESLSYKYNVEYKGEQKEIKGKIVTPKH